MQSGSQPNRATRYLASADRVGRVSTSHFRNGLRGIQDPRNWPPKNFRGLRDNLSLRVDRAAIECTCNFDHHSTLVISGKPFFCGVLAILHGSIEDTVTELTSGKTHVQQPARRRHVSAGSNCSMLGIMIPKQESLPKNLGGS